jgi:hypothetical protein
MMDDKLAKYPSNDTFKVIDTVGVPHPYCITPKHLGRSMYLDGNAIRDAESRGAKCGVRGCKLSFDEHRQALLIEVNHPADQVNDVPGLHEYVESIKEMCVQDNFVGFAFTKKRCE